MLSNLLKKPLLSSIV